ncbi:MAG TPA: hypothetical protein VKA69_04635, partial [Desulfobacteria bacterium]|nr:hypothetical protein [Desulfobacteria bacterium]
RPKSKTISAFSSLPSIKSEINPFEPQLIFRTETLMLTPFLLAKMFDSRVYFRVSDAGLMC